MPDSLLFATATHDRITFSNGNFAMTGAFSLGIVLQRTVNGAYNVMLSFELGATDYYFVLDNNGRVYTSNVADIYYQLPSGDPIVLTTDGWVLLVTTKAAGTVIPKLYTYEYTPNSWLRTTATASATQANVSGLSAITIGDKNASADLPASVVIAGFWDSELSQAQIDTLPAGTQAWIDLAPDELFRLNSMSTISSLTGTGAETSRTGTTVDTGDAPSGWTDPGVTTGSGPRNLLLTGVG